MADMPEIQGAFSSDSMRREKRNVARNSVLAALLITFLKIVVGLATQSLGILSEAAHSGLDLIAAVVTLFRSGFRTSRRTPIISMDTAR